MTACVDVPATGKKIKEFMIANDVSVLMLQDVVGVTSQAVYRWLHGQSLPSVDNLVILADVFKVKVDDILVIYHV